jgi:hypothetical protein
MVNIHIYIYNIYIIGADNLFGGLDCSKIDPGYIIVFTNCDDEMILQ